MGVGLLSPMLLAQAPAVAPSQMESSTAIPAPARQLAVLANEARAAAGVGPRQWDAALAAAALKHCQRMAAEGKIAHRYGGEADVAGRAAQAGAHFSQIEENIAVGHSLPSIAKGWMDSAEHRENLLNPDIDRIGVAVVASGGVLFAVSDYARAVPVRSQAQVEAAFAALLRAKGLTILKDPSEARSYCASSGRFQGPDAPSLLIRWENSELTQLPKSLADRVASGEYRQAAVGSCPPQDVEGTFTVYRVAVLLYGQDTANRLKPFYQPNDW